MKLTDMKLTLVTPEKHLVTDMEVEEIYIPAFKGELNILPQHAPLITTLEAGILKFREAHQGKLREVAVGWGYCEVHHDQISILAESAEFAEEIEYDRAKEDLIQTEQKLVSGTELESEFQRLQARVSLEKARLHVFDTRKVD